MPPNLINSSAVSSANYYLGKNQKNLQESIKRLASGKKISGPGDDPGNLAVSMKLNAQLSRISGLKIVSRMQFPFWRYRTVHCKMRAICLSV